MTLQRPGAVMALRVRRCVIATVRGELRLCTCGICNTRVSRQPLNTERMATTWSRQLQISALHPAQHVPRSPHISSSNHRTAHSSLLLCRDSSRGCCSPGCATRQLNHAWNRAASHTAACARALLHPQHRHHHTHPTRRAPTKTRGPLERPWPCRCPGSSGQTGPCAAHRGHA